MKFLLSGLLYIIAILNFLFIGFSVIVCTYLFKPKQYDKFVKFLCRFFLSSLFIRVKTSGLNNFDPNKTYVFMSNHVNIFDVFLLPGYIPNFARGVEQERHFNWPVWGKVTSRFGNIPINQTKLKSALNSLKLAEQAINGGTSIIILPEGHRTRDGEMRPFMRGPFLLAQKTKADIIPVAIIGAYEIKSVNHWLIRPGTLQLVFGETITNEKTKHLSSKELRDLVKEKIQALIDDSKHAI
jgi:1-acyl-sn-glycerol-3-phosphate acyltransferase